MSNEADWYPLARRLAREGYLVLTYNRRAVCSGEKAHYDCSAGANDWGRAWQNVVGAVRFVASRGARRVAVGGSSIGGTTAVYAAATGRIHPAALISLAGVNHISTYSLTRADVRRIGGAKLFVSGRRDLDGAAASAREFNRWARPPKRMVLLDTASPAVPIPAAMPECMEGGSARDGARPAGGRRPHSAGRPVRAF